MQASPSQAAGRRKIKNIQKLCPRCIKAKIKKHFDVTNKFVFVLVFMVVLFFTFVFVFDCLPAPTNKKQNFSKIWPCLFCLITMGWT